MRRFALPCLALSFAAALHAAEDEHSWTPLRDGADKAIQAAAAFETAQRKQTASPRIQLIPHGLVTISIDERLQALRASQDAENGIPLEEESSVGSVDPAVLMRNVEAALDAVASPSLIPEENAPSAGEAADAAGRAAAELIAAPVKDPLDDALLAPPPEPLDYVFLEAKLCFDQGRLDDLEEMLPLFEHHELSGYPALWALILKLKKFPDDPVVDQDFRRFIDLHEGEYLAENARTQYLKLRGEKLNAADFDLFFKGLVWNQTDPVIEAWQAYYTLESAQAENNQSKIAAALLKAKVLYRDSKAVTDPALMKLGDRISEADRTWLWTRVMILLQKNRMTETKRVLETLPRPELPAPMKELRSIIDEPTLWLRRQKNLGNLPARLAVFASVRIAHLRPADAARIAQAAVDPKANAFWRSLVWSRIGFTATTQLNPKASSWYAKAGSALQQFPLAVVDAQQLAAWHARALIRDGSWYGLSKVIDAMPAELKREEVWTYWCGRALASRGLKTDAQTAFTSIAHRTTFYGKLAADELGRSYGFSKPPKAMPRQVEIDKWAENTAIQRARSLYRMSLYREGHREWNWAMRGITPQESLALAAYARQTRLIHRMINTSLKSGDQTVVIEQRFPRPHAALIRIVSEAQSLPSAWVYGLIRQESRFIPAVSSAVGARGLMQIMPATAQWMARHLGIDSFEQKSLTELEMNLVLGTAYLRMLYLDMEESYVLATAAYNAGPNRARIWRAAVRNSMEAAAFIETIPYFETREYVKNVLANMHTYAMLTGELDGRFAKLLGRVEPGRSKAADLP